MEINDEGIVLIYFALFIATAIWFSINFLGEMLWDGCLCLSIVS